MFNLFKKIYQRYILKKDRKNANKEIGLYAILESSTNDIIAFAPTVELCANISLKHAIESNKEHYTSWCVLRNLDTSNKDSYAKYINNCLGGLDGMESKYKVQRVYLNATELAEIFNATIVPAPVKRE